MPLFQNAVLNKYLLGINEQKVKLTFGEEAEWLDYFNQQKARADALKTQIAQTDSEIDGMVMSCMGWGRRWLGLWRGVFEMKHLLSFCRR